MAMTVCFSVCLSIHPSVCLSIDTNLSGKYFNSFSGTELKLTHRVPIYMKLCTAIFITLLRRFAECLAELSLLELCKF